MIDQNKIITILYLNFGFKIFKNICYLLILSYYLGIIFYIFTDIAEGHDKESSDLATDASSIHLRGFINSYFNEDDTLTYRVIILSYFSFTSLTTVGFGDFVPRSDSERLFTAIVIFCGVAVFSYIVGNFVMAIENFYLIQDEFDEGEDLYRFFGLLKNFNSGNNINKKLIQDFESYFEYKWQNDRN